MSFFNESSQNKFFYNVHSSYEETKNVQFKSECYYLLESGLKIAYHHSYHDHEDEFGKWNDFDPNKDIRIPAEIKYKSKVVKMCFLVWEEHTVSRQYWNELQTRTITTWREKQKIFDTQMRHLTTESAQKAVQEWFKNNKMLFPLRDYQPLSLKESPTQP
jgi:hypothetical protein